MENIVSEIVNEIDNILNLNSNSNIFIYPKFTVDKIDSTDISYVPTKININESNNMLIDKITNMNIEITEYHFRDFSKMIQIISRQNKQQIDMTYIKTQVFGKTINECFLCWHNYIKIDESKFPLAENGLRKETKNIKILKIPELNLKLVSLILENNCICIRIDIYSISNQQKKDILIEIINCINYIEKFY